MRTNRDDNEVSNPPTLRVDYSPDLQLLISCSEVEGYIAGIDCVCVVTCRVLHTRGHFEYLSGRLRFCIDGSDSFTSFLEALRQVQRGESSCAVLKNLGEDFVLTLETADQLCRRVKVNIAARENEAEIDGFATLQLSVELDYDLYVNRLLEALVVFVRDLRGFARSVGKLS